MKRNDINRKNKAMYDIFDGKISNSTAKAM